MFKGAKLSLQITLSVCQLVCATDMTTSSLSAYRFSDSLCFFFEFIIRIFFNVQIICNNIFFGGSEPASANLSVCPVSVLMSSVRINVRMLYMGFSSISTYIC